MRKAPPSSKREPPVFAATLLRDGLFESARHEVGHGAALHEMRNILEISHLAEVIRGAVLIVDPATLLSMLEDGHSHGCWPSKWLTVLYSTTEQSDVRALLECVGQFAMPVILSGHGAPSFRLQELVSEAPGILQSARILAHLAPSLVALPPDLAAHVVGVFASHGGASSLKQLAARSKLSDRHAHRVLVDTGIPSSHRLVAAAPVLRAYDDVADGVMTLGEIVCRHGFGSRRVLRSRWKDVLGVELDDSRGVPLTAELIESVASRLRS